MKALIPELCLQTGLREHEIQRIMSTAPSRYKVFNIKKRNGSLREIAQPAPEVKLLQRAIMKSFLKELPVHASATAYVPGGSILSNAQPHAKNGPILKLDFKDFFPSLRSTDWIAYCKRTKCLEDEQEILLTSRLLFRRAKGRSILRLAIGAPSSPMLSNILMHEFDVRVVEAVQEQKVTYTRYADDMTFSAPRLGYLNDVMQKVAHVIRALDSPNLDLNGDKTTYVTKKYGRSVTGLVLANDGRVTIGRERKRTIRAAVHRALKGLLDPLEMQVLVGTLAYVNAVEPVFMEVLRAKYGTTEIDRIQRAKRDGKLSFHSPPLAPNQLNEKELQPLHRLVWHSRRRW
jgi:RNA-directed DNA polymerase